MTIGQVAKFLDYLPTNVANPGEEIKTALQVKIEGRRKDQDGTVYYAIRLWLIWEPEKLSNKIEKRYTNFVQLHSELLSNGFDNLPNLPAKKLFMNDEDNK